MSEKEDKQEIKRAGYGLPCAKCNTYFFADQDACPVCGSRERAARLSLVTKVKPAISLPIQPPASTDKGGRPVTVAVPVAQPASPLTDCWSIIIGKNKQNKNPAPTAPVGTDSTLSEMIAAGDFKQRCLELIEQVKTKGKSFVISDNGRVLARLVPD